uniref:Uncharacterized protein LOC111112626 n=1 Tax=Crassostrea virginica TaxID=6565 RepID=A0A8B8BRK3_CRAVI|nr:uncharacterized protein LOC111112626 [Crassostrea virginica]
MAARCDVTSDSTDENRGEISEEIHLGSDFVEMFSYSEVQEKVFRLLTSSTEFAKTQDFITHIMNYGCGMQQAVEQLNTRKTDLMTECAVVIAGETSSGNQ